MSNIADVVIIDVVVIDVVIIDVVVIVVVIDVVIGIDVVVVVKINKVVFECVVFLTGIGFATHMIRIPSALAPVVFRGCSARWCGDL